MRQAHARPLINAQHRPNTDETRDLFLTTAGRIYRFGFVADGTSGA